MTRGFDFYFDLRLISENKPEFLISEIIFWYQKFELISDIRNSYDFLISENDFLISEIQFLISENQHEFLISENHFMISEINFWY